VKDAFAKKFFGVGRDSLAARSHRFFGNTLVKAGHLMRPSVVSGAVRGLALQGGQGLAAPIQNEAGHVFWGFDFARLIGRFYKPCRLICRFFFGFITGAPRLLPVPTALQLLSALHAQEGAPLPKLPPLESPRLKGPKYAPPSRWACAGITSSASAVAVARNNFICFSFCEFGQAVAINLARAARLLAAALNRNLTSSTRSR
jgi:hypothetical protein